MRKITSTLLARIARLSNVFKCSSLRELKFCSFFFFFINYDIRYEIWQLPATLTLRLLYGRSIINLAAIDKSPTSAWPVDADDDGGGGNDVSETDCFIGLVDVFCFLSVVGEPIFESLCKTIFSSAFFDNVGDVCVCVSKRARDHFRSRFLTFSSWRRGIVAHCKRILCNLFRAPAKTDNINFEMEGNLWSNQLVSSVVKCLTISVRERVSSVCGSTSLRIGLSP